jgi:tetratricopeptide (TPR) repeat protein
MKWAAAEKGEMRTSAERFLIRPSQLSPGLVRSDMPGVSSSFGAPQTKPSPTRQRFQVVKLSLACALLLILLYSGLRGRQRVLFQARVDELTLICNQLQHRLDEVPSATEKLIGSAGAIGQPPASSQDVQSLINTLKSRLSQFDSDFGSSRLSTTQREDIRVCTATLGNAEQRFADALAAVKVANGGEKSLDSRGARILKVQADAYYGLHQLPEALASYQQMLTLEPGRLEILAWIADCQYGMDRMGDAAATYRQLALGDGSRGADLLAQGKVEAAIRRFQKATDIQSWLFDKQGRAEVAGELAAGHDLLGDGFLLQGKGPAVGEYQKAIELRSRLLDKDRQNDVAIALARSEEHLGDALLAHGKTGSAVDPYRKAIELRTSLSQPDALDNVQKELVVTYNNLGSSLLGQQKLDAALEQYGQAIKLATELTNHAQSGVVTDLAVSYNNRGVVRRLQGKNDLAAGDFENAVTLLTQSGPAKDTSPPEQQSPTIAGPKRVGDRIQVKLDVALGYSEKSVEVLARTRLLDQGARRAQGTVLAMSLKNRAYLRLATGKVTDALGDFRTTAEIYTKLLNLDEQNDMAVPLARTLSVVAWTFATYPNDLVRNGRKANEYAVKACELTQWKAAAPLESLAAACAESGNFGDAVKWAEKALELAPADQKAAAHSRLDLYKAGRPYRAAVNAVNSH